MTGGPDLEDSGPCNNERCPPAFETAAVQSLAVIDYAKSQPYVDPRSGLLVGQSFGGATSVALAAKNVDGVVGTINFAGGSGGDPDRRPADPCAEHELARTCAMYGKSVRRPTLRLYSENDRYWGADYPRRGFDAFRSAGGAGEFVQLPASGHDGHMSFRDNPLAWRPHVERFLKSVAGPR